MKRTQLNVSIDPKLLEKIKESARISGKSLVSYVSDCFVNQIENLPVESIDSRFHMIEQRLQSLEKKLDFPEILAVSLIFSKSFGSILTLSWVLFMS